MTTPKKKHLIELMIEANVKWPDGAKYAAQDKKDIKLYFYRNKPGHSSEFPTEWMHSELDNRYGAMPYKIKLSSLCHNWYQTIVTREQYEQALANATISIEDSQCNSVIGQVSDRTIGQLADDYYAKAAEAEHLQAAADKALKLADEALITLQKAGEVIGLVISVDNMQKHTEQHQQPLITDWWDLQVGDVIECIYPWGGKINSGDIGTITLISTNELLATFEKQRGYLYKREHLGTKFRFIRRS